MNPIAEMHRQIDAVTEALAKASAAKGNPVTCPGKGCCACCCEPVYTSSREVEYLVESLNEEQRAAVTERLRLAIKKVRTFCLFDVEMPPVMDWLAMSLPCPLLQDGACIAYDRRPTGCRSHIATGPPEWCSTRRLEQRYPQSREASIVQGHAIVNAHLKLGNTIINDNLLALLSNELLKEPFETASGEVIVLNETNGVKT